MNRVPFRRLGALAALATVCGLTLVPVEAQAVTLPSMFCDFEEPLLQWIVLSPEGVLIEAHDDGATFNRYKPTAISGSAKSRLKVTLPKAAGSTLMVITKQDGYYSHSIEFDDREGSCSVFPAGYVIRKTTGVAEGDVLNIRASASADAEVVGTYDDGRLVWVKPSKSAWIRTAFIPPSDDEEAGDDQIVLTGWVRSTFITKTIPKTAHAS